MDKIILIFFAIYFSLNSNAQTSLDSLRLVLPVGHTDCVNSAVFSPDGKFALTASNDKTARIYDVTSGKELQVLKGHSDNINSAMFSPDGKLALTASDDKTVRIYKVATGKELQILSGHKSVVKSAVFSPDGKLALTASDDKTARIYELATGEELQILSGHKSGVKSIAFSPDGKQVLTASDDKTVRIYEVATGKELQNLSGHNSGINSAVFSKDGKSVLTASSDNTAHIYELSTGRRLQILTGHTGSINTAVFSSDGNLALTASEDSTARIYEVATGKELQVLIGHTFCINSAVFSPDCKLALTASIDNTSRIYEVATGKEKQILSGHENSVNTSVFSIDGNLVLTASADNTARIYEVSTSKEIQVLNGQTNFAFSAVFSTDGKLFLTANSDFTARIYLVSAGKNLHILRGHNDNLTSAIFSRDSKNVLTASDDNTSRIFEVISGQERQVIGGETTISEIEDKKMINDSASISFTQSSFEEIILELLEKETVNSADLNQDGKLVIISRGDKAFIYEVSTSRELQLLSGHSNDVNSAVFSADGKLVLTASWDNTARIWDVATGKTLQILRGHKDIVKSALFSPNGKLALTASDDETARIYEVATGKELRVLRGHTDDVNSAVFSIDNKLVITASSDNTSRIYEVNTGKELQVFSRLTAAINSAVFSPDGRHILTTSDDHFTRVWDVESSKSIYELIEIDHNNWLVKLPNSPYYMCSKDASKMLHYVTPSLKVIGFEQLDPIYNRPDIVLDSIGKYFGGADQELIANYRQSWEKRIDRLGLDKEKLGKGEISVPNAEIVRADEIAYESKEGKLEINVSANDPKYPLRRFNVYVNEVPLYESAGISIAHLKKQVWDTTVSVPLSTGENKIQVSVMNELGLENFKYPTYVNYSPQNGLVAKTFFIGIGVNEFLEQEHNLKYCVKDVQDLAMAFADGNSHVDTLLLTNKEVTRENILALKDYLMKTSVNDKVIISCSSHGLLDDSLNFYLAMHDVDFNNPQARGLKYEELESLLDGIPARQKLLLLDACNSGENDKTEVLKKELEQKQVKMKTDEVLAARGAIVELKEENKSNFQKMNELFVNVRNNTGSVIISAAGGQEFALEGNVDGKTIENGAFTYSVLEYLNSNKTNSKTLTVNKLKQYTEKRVEEITNGKQKPTSRQETMEVDWGVR